MGQLDFFFFSQKVEFFWLVDFFFLAFWGPPFWRGALGTCLHCLLGNPALIVEPLLTAPCTSLAASHQSSSTLVHPVTLSNNNRYTCELTNDLVRAQCNKMPYKICQQFFLNISINLLFYFQNRKASLSFFSIMLIFGVLEGIVAIIAAVFCCHGCCCQSRPGVSCFKTKYFVKCVPVLIVYQILQRKKGIRLHLS